MGSICRMPRGGVVEKCGMEFQRTVSEKWEKQEAPVELAVYEIERTKWEK
ncbi:MAG TPA: hypothetical protein VHS06_09875 [Chloroflexota bacterium]|nr:hypothetical protein [Chloroflexota bacterium]